MNDPSGEEALLSACVRGLGDAVRGPGVLTGIGDDAAVLMPPPAERLVATVDMLVEGQHFLRHGPSAILPEDLGWRALAVNLSDIAAMGACPRWALCSVGAPPGLDGAELERLYAGLGDAARAFGVAVVGGNLARMPEHLVIDVTLLGTATHVVQRTGANPGDLICVTGRLGAGAAGLAWILQSEHGCPEVSTDAARYVTAVQRRPAPRVAEGRALAALDAVHAMCDISDGLTRDLAHLCRPGLGAVLWQEALPIPAPVREVARGLGQDPVQWALHGGEDYELLCAVSPDRCGDAAAAVHRAGTAGLHVIGEFRSEQGLWLAEAAGGPAAPLMPRGWDPFA